MRTILLLLAAAAFCAGQTAKDLDEVARIATAMVDGDLCQRIVTARAMNSILQKDPRDRYLASDNYDVNHEPFIRTKKTLIRLSKLVEFPCDVNLWMPIPADPPRIHIVIRNVHEMSQFWTWGALHQEMFPPMKRVLETGERLTVTEKPGWISVLAPVRNSLGDIVGLVEVVSRTKPDARENVK
ncbi:MAG: hypothetical protein GY953_02240 [bacterium]|nr:hypothetical protein [bacterium]